MKTLNPLSKFLLSILLILTSCASHSRINPNNYTKESKKIPTTYGSQPTILVFLLETNLKNPVWISRVQRDSKQQINEIFPRYYKGKYKIVSSYGEFDKYEDISLHRYVVHYKVIFPTQNSRDGQYSPNYGDDKYQIFIEDITTALHYEPSVITSDYEGLLKVFGEALEKERDRTE
ncbi:hypothetical protein [Bernardetia sp.]|uniref:hypothetical protein n=1 Tax=Bernardetia sp. TaxID=1937974 RepID=UPI0025C38242|nr:hypothetical protein [Bernardetia sp.]